MTAEPIAFKYYLMLAPDAPNRADVQREIRVLEVTIDGNIREAAVRLMPLIELHPLNRPDPYARRYPPGRAGAMFFSTFVYLGDVDRGIAGAGFCNTCNRLRVTARGRLRLCLFGRGGVDLRDVLQDDGREMELLDRVRAALGTKASGHRLHEGDAGNARRLAEIGG